MPSPNTHVPLWATVAAVGNDKSELRESLGPSTYETKTRGSCLFPWPFSGGAERWITGTRHQPAARPVGVGAYVLHSKPSSGGTGGTTHLAYVLATPSTDTDGDEVGKVQKDLNIYQEASVTVRTAEDRRLAALMAQDRSKSKTPRRMHHPRRRSQRTVERHIRPRCKRCSGPSSSKSILRPCSTTSDPSSSSSAGKRETRGFGRRSERRLSRRRGKRPKRWAIRAQKTSSRISGWTRARRTRRRSRGIGRDESGDGVQEEYIAACARATTSVLCGGGRAGYMGPQQGIKSVKTLRVSSCAMREAQED